MVGWILYHRPPAGQPSASYGVRRLLEAGERLGVQLRIVAPEDLEVIVTRNDRKSVLLEGEHVPLPNFILPRLGAHTHYFALAMIRHLEHLGVHAFNTSHAIEMVRDKLYTQQVLAESDVPVPKTMLAKSKVDVDLVERTLGFPVILKTLSGLKGSGVYLAEDRENFENIMDLITSTNEKVNLILQEFVADSRGRDLRVFVVGGQPIAAMVRKSAGKNFRSNFSKGGTVEPFEITPEVAWLSSEICRRLKLDIAGIDLLFHGDHFQVCEANSSPGFEGLEQCTDLDIANEVLHYVLIRLGAFDLASKAENFRQRV